MKFKIRTHLPEDIHGVRYVKNTHFLEIEDDKERVWRGGATGVVKYVCKVCKGFLYSPSNYGRIPCNLPGCGQSMMDPQWHKPQLSFVPEEVSDFRDGSLEGLADEDTDAG